MGWDVPEMYIERAIGSDSEPQHWGLIGKPWYLFGSLEYSKVFLLGHGKYGPQPGWDPARELRGLPDNPSSEVARLREMSDREITDATWLTLSELESINLDIPVGLPDDIDPVLRDPTRYFNFSKTSIVKKNTPPHSS